MARDEIARSNEALRMFCDVSRAYLMDKQWGQTRGERFHNDTVIKQSKRHKWISRFYYRPDGMLRLKYEADNA